jgi:ketosteroid isomerase-like protein
MLSPKDRRHAEGLSISGLGQPPTLEVVNDIFHRLDLQKVDAMVKIRKIVLGIAAATAMLSLFEQDLQAQTMTAEQNKAAILSSFNAWSAGTGSPFDLLAEDARWTIEGNGVASKTYTSREEFMRDVIRPFNTRMESPLKPSIRNLYADGDTVIAFFDARGVARDGKPYVNTYAWFMEMKAGKIIRASAFFDAIAFNDLWRRVAVTVPPSSP